MATKRVGCGIALEAGMSTPSMSFHNLGYVWMQSEERGDAVFESQDNAYQYMNGVNDKNGPDKP